MHERVKAGVVSVVRSKARPMIMRTLETDGKATPILQSRQILRRQDEQIFYELNGAIYINDWSELTPNLKLGYNPYAYIMDEISSIDVDHIEDFELAEKCLTQRISSCQTSHG